MRLSIFISVLAHLAVAALAVLQWPSLASASREAPQIVPIDIVIGDVTDVRATAPPAAEELEPEPPPENDPEAAAPAPAPETAPPPPDARRPPTPRQQELDLSDLRRQLLESRERETPRERRPPGAAEGDRVREGAGRSAGETASLEAYFAALARSHIDRNQCWNDPIDRLQSDALMITVVVRLSRGGEIVTVGAPRVLAGGRVPQAVQEDAVRAARRCAPYPFPDDPNGPANYDLWRELELCFGEGCG